MVKYTLTYFNIRGRGEVARMVFKAAGQDFEDKRITGEEFAKLKPSLPNGQLPILEIDGQVLSQSMTIARYLAREFGFVGKDNIAKARVDEIMDTCGDFFTELAKSFFEKDEAKKAEMAKTLKEETVPKYFAVLEKVLEKNGTGFFVGSSLTVADLCVYEMITNILARNAQALEAKYKHLIKNRKLVEVQKFLKEYLEQRPKSDI